MRDRKLTVKAAMREYLEATQAVDDTYESPFYVCDLGHVARQHRQWCEQMPHIKPFYAVKCNPDPRLVHELASLGTGFDCASRAEMEIVLSQGVDPSRIIFANPCKTRACLRFARQHQVAKMTFDNADELVKISREYPQAQLFLRVKANDPSALSPLGEKFGASVEDAFNLVRISRKLDLNLVGVSFHVGSGFKDLERFDVAIRDCRTVWDYAARLNFDMRSLDIGGGFSEDTFLRMAPAGTASIHKYFGDVQNLYMIAEPGRFLAEGAYTVACCIIAKRGSRASSSMQKDIPAMLYLSDGVFGDFSNVTYENDKPSPRVLKLKDAYFPLDGGRKARKEADFSMWGPTCDSHDCLGRDAKLPADIGTGDWLYFEKSGAYSLACATQFNGFKNAREIVYVH